MWGSLYFKCWLVYTHNFSPVCFRLKQFYLSSSNLQYFKHLVQVPYLPDVSSTFRFNFIHVNAHLTLINNFSLLTMFVIKTICCVIFIQFHFKIIYSKTKICLFTMWEKSWFFLKQYFWCTVNIIIWIVWIFQQDINAWLHAIIIYVWGESYLVHVKNIEHPLFFLFFKGAS